MSLEYLPPFVLFRVTAILVPVNLGKLTHLSQSPFHDVRKVVHDHISLSFKSLPAIII
jgi:hypothetical protein